MTESATSACANPTPPWDRMLEDCELPTLPSVAMVLLELCGRPDATPKEFASVIRVDPAMSARLLRVANSAFFGLRFKVTTVERAAIVLGTNYLKATALGFKLAEVMRAFAGSNFDAAEFWRDSLLRACLARRLAIRVVPERAEEAFLVGLLQDIGIPVLASLLGEPYVRALHESDGCRLRLFLREAEEFEINHVVAAAKLCSEWNLPKLLSWPIIRHHTRPPIVNEPDEVARLWQIAYFVGAAPLAQQQDRDLAEPALRGFALTAFRTSLEDLHKVFAKASAEFEAIRGMFEDILPADCDPNALMERAAELFNELADELPGELKKIL